MPTPPPGTHEDAERTAVLELMTYLEFKVKNLTSVNEIIENAKKKQDISDGKKQSIAIIESYIRQHQDFGEIVLTDQSTELSLEDQGIMPNPKGFKAYTFKESTGEYIVAFSGTPNHAWVVNADAFGPAQDNIYYEYDSDGNIQRDADENIVSTTMPEYFSASQAMAVNYFDYITAKFELNQSDHITITGHSQGDNNAKTVTLKRDLVDVCYAFDGQGYSPEAIDELQTDPQFAERLKKIYQFRNDNNVVDGFGYDIGLAEQTYYHKGPVSRGEFKFDHFFETQFVQDEHGNWGFAPYTDKGRGFLTRAIYDYTAVLMQMPEDVRGGITRGIMQVTQQVLIREGTAAFENPANLREVCMGMAATIAAVPTALVKEIRVENEDIAAMIYTGALLYSGVFGGFLDESITPFVTKVLEKRKKTETVIEKKLTEIGRAHV